MPPPPTPPDWHHIRPTRPQRKLLLWRTRLFHSVNRLALQPGTRTWVYADGTVPLLHVVGMFGAAVFTAVITLGLYVLAASVPGVQLGLLLGTLTQNALVIGGLILYGLRLIDRQYVRESAGI